MSTAANPDVVHFRWADDDNAAHESCTLLGSEDTGLEIPNLGTAFLLIVKIHNDGDMSASGDYRLQYNKDAAGWNDVNAASSNIRTIAGQDTDGATGATERLTATAETFQTSVFDDGDSLIATNVGGGDDYEFYYSIEFRSADNSGGESYEFRVLSGGSTITHDVTITGTVEISANRDVICATEVLEAAESVAAINRARTVLCSTEVLELSSSASVSISRNVNTITEVVVLNALTSTINRERNVNCVTEQLSLSGVVSTINRTRNVVCSVESLVLTEVTATIARNRDVSCSTEILELTAMAATIRKEDAYRPMTRTYRS